MQKVSEKRLDKEDIGKLIYVQDHWYTQPYGCMEGDYWNMGEGLYVCPFCGMANRLSHREDVVELKYSFKEVIKTYRDSVVVVKSIASGGKSRYHPMLKKEAVKQGIMD